MILENIFLSSKMTHFLSGKSAAILSCVHKSDEAFWGIFNSDERVFGTKKKIDQKFVNFFEHDQFLRPLFQVPTSRLKCWEDEFEMSAKHSREQERKLRELLWAAWERDGLRESEGDSELCFFITAQSCVFKNSYK